MRKNNQKGFAPILILVILVLGIAGYFVYQNFQIKKDLPLPTTQPTSLSDEVAEKVKECYAKTQCEGPVPCMANPASVFCICMGGELEIRENDKGESGVCKIDGKEYDEWEYFRKMNPKDTTYSFSPD